MIRCHTRTAIPKGDPALFPVSYFRPMAKARPRLPGPRHHPGGLTVMALLLSLGLILAACEPQKVIPMNPSRLIVPARDVVQHRRLELPNGLRVMLVSNPRADHSAAAMAVGTGSLDDPKSRPGMAHFMEHMLFLGTERYPEPGGYSRFMASHDGSSNAYTADDHTNYFFSVAHDAFEEGLDRFAWFFIAPLFDQKYTERELNAVDSEHAKNLENDFWRVRQVQRTIYKASHPINRFSTGNRATLQTVTREELLEFYRTRYSANRMTLTVVGVNDLDTLEKLVRERFEKVANRNLKATQYPAEFFPREPALRLLRVEPVGDRRSLLMQYPLPPQQAHYRARPVSIVASLLGHEGAGSLLSLLKDEGLATALSASSGESTNGYSSLMLRIELTAAGLEKYMRVVERVQGVINTLRGQGIPRHVYGEYSTMALLDFTYRAAQDSANQARMLSALMQSVPLKDLPEAGWLIPDHRPDLYKQVLDHLQPDNLLVTLVARGQPTDKTEPYYGTGYVMEALTGAPYETLVRAKAPRRWHVPTANAFIPRATEPLEPEGALKIGGTTLRHLQNAGMPKDLLKEIAGLKGTVYPDFASFQQAVSALMPDKKTLARWLPQVTQDAVPMPEKVLDTPMIRLWHLPDWRLQQPKASVIFRIHTAGAYADPETAMLARLHAEVFAESLNEESYPIREAGLSFDLEATRQGYRLSLGGYADRMLDLLGFLGERLPLAEVSQETFETIRDRIRRDLENQRFAQPFQQVRTFTRLLMSSPAYSNEAMLKALDDITLEQVQGHAARVFERVYVQGVTAGSLHPDRLRAATHTMLETLGAEPLDEAERTEVRVLPVPKGADQVFSERMGVGNSLVLNHYDGGQSEPRLRGALLIVGRHLREDFYFHMRTQQQLGYIVWAGMGQELQRLNMYFIVQSGEYGADELARRMEKYLEEYAERFAALPPEQFEKLRQAVINAKLERPKNLEESARRLFWVAYELDGNFDHVSEDISAVESLQREDVQRQLERVLQPPSRGRLRIHLVGKQHRAAPLSGQPVGLPQTVRGAAD